MDWETTTKKLADIDTAILDAECTTRLFLKRQNARSVSCSVDLLAAYPLVSCSLILIQHVVSVLRTFGGQNASSQAFQFPANESQARTSVFSNRMLHIRVFLMFLRRA